MQNLGKIFGLSAIGASLVIAGIVAAQKFSDTAALHLIVPKDALKNGDACVLHEAAAQAFSSVAEVAPNVVIQIRSENGTLLCTVGQTPAATPE